MHRINEIDVGAGGECGGVLATLSLWTAFLEPMLVSGRRYHREQFAFAAVIFGAVVLIYGGQGPQSATGFLVAIV